MNKVFIAISAPFRVRTKIVLITRLFWKRDCEFFRNLYSIGMRRKEVTGNKLAHLSTADEQLIRLLAHTPMTTAQVAEHVGAPFNTAKYRLERLHARGWLKRIRKKRTRLWHGEAPELHTERIGKFLDRVFMHQSTRNLRTYGSDEAVFIDGLDQFRNIYTFCSSRDTSQQNIYGTQTIESTAALIDICGSEFSNQVNYDAAQHKAIYHCVLPADYYEKLGETNGVSWLQSFLGRTADTHIVAEKLLNTQADIQIAGDRVYLINWQDANALCLKHPALISTIQTLFTCMHTMGRKIDQNQHIRELIEKMERKEAAEKE